VVLFQKFDFNRISERGLGTATSLKAEKLCVLCRVMIRLIVLSLSTALIATTQALPIVDYAEVPGNSINVIREKELPAVGDYDSVDYNDGGMGISAANNEEKFMTAKRNIISALRAKMRRSKMINGEENKRMFSPVLSVGEYQSPPDS
jgi:hypothetical protein